MASKKKFRAAILGATGYGGMQLLRWLLSHPGVEVVAVSSESSAGQPLLKVLPHLKGIDLTLLPAAEACCTGDPQVIFSALPNGEAMRMAPEFMKRGITVIDMSADFRLLNPAVYEAYYKNPHTSPQLLGQAVYGIPELYRAKIRVSRLIANPGCYPTSALLALVPLLQAGLISPQGIIVDSKSGISGAGRNALKTQYLFTEANEDVCAYNIGTHRHTPEIEQQLSLVGKGEVVITFTPHLIPMSRGILTTAYANPLRECSTAVLLEAYRQAYDGDEFVTILDADTLPHTKWCLGSNQAFITARVDERTGQVIALSVLDNLGKGMAGQAVQCMNLIAGFSESLGISHTAIYP